MKIILTQDGSTTVQSSQYSDTYHSTHGAVQESQYVFIEQGLHSCLSQDVDRINILEIGMGTGLNVLLTVLNSTKPVHYTALEPFPLEQSIVKQLNFSEILSNKKSQALLEKIHYSSWDEQVKIKDDFILNKKRLFLQDYVFDKKYHLIYFDAFSPDAQPDLWKPEVFQRLFEFMYPKGILVTYCAKGIVRRILQEVGFHVERLEGPPGKREMLRALKE